jgi:hypothetical protein
VHGAGEARNHVGDVRRQVGARGPVLGHGADLRRRAWRRCETAGGGGKA